MLFMFLLVVCLFGSTIAQKPDEAFATCCKEKSLPDSCQTLCSYDINPEEVSNAFGNGTCSPEQNFSPYYQCMMNHVDKTECCQYVGGNSTFKAHEGCLDLCNGETPIIYDEKYLKCKPLLPIVMSCGIDSHSSIPLKPEERPYTEFADESDWVFNGRVICFNGEPIGDAKVKLMEYDPMTFNDVVASSYIIGNTFQLVVDKYYTDTPSSTLDLYLVFEGFCGYSTDRVSGYLVNGTVADYTLYDDSLYAVMYG